MLFRAYRDGDSNAAYLIVIMLVDRHSMISFMRCGVQFKAIRLKLKRGLYEEVRYQTM